MEDILFDDVGSTEAPAPLIDQARREITGATFDFKLAAFRAENPFIPITKFPATVNTYKLTASTAQTVNIPSGAKFCVIGRSSGLNLFCSRTGDAFIPGGATDNGEGCILNPDGLYFWIEGARSLSIIGDANGYASVFFFSQN